MTLTGTIEAALETSEIVINIITDSDLTNTDKHELIDAILCGGE